MIANLIEYAIRRRFIVLLLTAAVALWGVYCLFKTPVDAIPDLSENQVIVFTDWMGRSPREIDDQVTYPLSVNLQGLAGVKAVRSRSEFNFSMINVIFDDAIDFYFARTRVQERLAAAATYLPPGVVPYMAPDATALGQIFWYTVEGEGLGLDELRAIQDWYVRYQLYVPGVAEVASVGGFVREYQVDVDPEKLRAFGIPVGAVFDAVARSNLSVGGKVYYEASAEYLIRGIGWLRGVRDIENVVVAERDGVPVTVQRLATVQLGPEYRRSLLEKNGREAVGGVVMMRFGENPLEVTRAIRAKIEQLQPGLPPGVRIVPFYERTRLITDAIRTLTDTLFEELLVASLAVILILRHLRSALIVCVTLPLAVLIAFIFMYYLGVPSNIMSLSGIAISIGLFVDAAVVMVENTTHELTRRFEGRRVTGDTTEATIAACRMVGQPIFFAVLIMLVSFIPVFALGGLEGRMFHPLAWTKSLAMIGVAIAAVTFVPAAIPLFVRGRLQREQDNWFVRSFIDIYKPVLNWLLDVPAAGIWFLAFLFILAAGLIGNNTLFLLMLVLSLFFGTAFFRRFHSRAIAFTLLLATAAWSWHLPKVGSEFMPSLDEGGILDMPVTVPRVSMAQAGDDIRIRDAVMRGFPEVDQVVGKVGRADTPTDPSGIDMVETVVTLRPLAWWPKRHFRYDDIKREAWALFGTLQTAGALSPNLTDAAAQSWVNEAAMAASFELDRQLRETVRTRQLAEAGRIADQLSRAFLDDLLAHFRAKGLLRREPDDSQRADCLAALRSGAAWMVDQPRREELFRMIVDSARRLADAGILDLRHDALLPADSPWSRIRDFAAQAVGREKETLASRLFDDWQARLDAAWTAHAKQQSTQLDQTAFRRAEQLLADYLLKPSPDKPAPLDPAALTAILDTRAAAFRRAAFLWRKTKTDLTRELDSAVQMPGWGNIWTQPIINRVNMLATGVRTMIGVKVFGPRLEDENGQPGIQSVANEIAAVLKPIPGAVDVFPDQIVGRSYLHIEINREKAARYGVNVADVAEAIEVAMGGKAITTTVEGRQRFPVRVRYARDYRESREAVRRILVTGRRENGAVYQIPIAEVTDIRVVEGPSVIPSDNGMLRAYVQLNVRDRDVVGFVEEARQAVAARVALPPGFSVEWSGEFEHQVRARKRLEIIFPIVVLVMFVILYMTFNDVRDALLIMLAVPGALAGGVIFQSLFGFDFSVAVWVGYIACFGEATQTGIVMLVYLHEAIRSRGGLEKIGSLDELRHTILEGAVHRLRPKLITEGVAIIGLMPMLWATGVGAEVMRPMAAPVLGGLLVADEVIDLLLPVIFNWYQSRQWRRLHSSGTPAPSPASA